MKYYYLIKVETFNKYSKRYYFDNIDDFLRFLKRFHELFKISFFVRTLENKDDNYTMIESNFTDFDEFSKILKDDYVSLIKISGQSISGWIEKGEVNTTSDLILNQIEDLIQRNKRIKDDILRDIILRYIIIRDQNNNEKNLIFMDDTIFKVLKNYLKEHIAQNKINIIRDNENIFEIETDTICQKSLTYVISFKDFCKELTDLIIA